MTLKLKTAKFRIKTRSISLSSSTQLADRIFRVAREALQKEADGTVYRLLGVGITNLCPSFECDPADLVDPAASKRALVERASDKVREKFGSGSVVKGRSFHKPSTAGRR